MTSPPSMVFSRDLRSAGNATLRPTCFMKHAALAPEYAAAPKATSNAQSSFVDHSVWIFTSSIFLKYTTPGNISELGVPGYAAAISRPASTRPRAMA